MTLKPLLDSIIELLELIKVNELTNQWLNLTNVMFAYFFFINSLLLIFIDRFIKHF